jgi:hypothetical protein
MFHRENEGIDRFAQENFCFSLHRNREFGGPCPGTRVWTTRILSPPRLSITKTLSGTGNWAREGGEDFGQRRFHGVAGASSGVAESDLNLRRATWRRMLVHLT